MKIRRLTQEKGNGQITLVKKDIDFDMLSPVIAKVLTEAIEQLADFEKRAVNEELMEVPYPLKSKMQLQLENRMMTVEVAGYEVTSKDIVIILETNDSITLKIPYKDAMSRLKKIGSVNAV